MKLFEIVDRFEKILVPILFFLVIFLASALGYVWWQALNGDASSRPGDFLKTEGRFK